LQRNDIWNLSISEEIYRRFEEQSGFDEVEIQRFLAEIISRADEEALNQLRDRANRLVPYIWDDGGRKPTVNEIVKGKRLCLRLYWTFGKVSWDSIEAILSLEKLMSIALYDQKPSKAEGWGIANMIEMFRGTLKDYNQAKKYTYSNDDTESIRIYKNGRFEITFKKEEYAKKVAKLLLNQ